QRQIAACVRQFGPVSENHGYKYIYLRLKHRMPTAHLRSTLKKLRIDTSRILDLHFPDRCVAALLVHNDYAEELIAQLSALGIQPHDLFDPLDPAIIRDPELLATLDEAERREKARALHRTNLLRALAFIRVPVKFAVARSFVKSGWLEQTDVDAFFSS
ncbi:hypothetical protein BCR43DRAFT_418253, partial [Syncephalastrum racemosum]